MRLATIKSFILSLIVGLAFGLGFSSAVFAQSPTTLQQKCPNTSIYARFTISALGAETATPCVNQNFAIVASGTGGILGTSNGTGDITFQSDNYVNLGDYDGVGNGTHLEIISPLKRFIFSDGTQSALMSYSGINYFAYQRTITPALTVGAQTINKPAGTVNFAAGAASLDITNSTVTANSIPFVVIRTADSTCTFVKSAVSTTGHLVITLNAACNAETSVGFIITN